MDMKMLDSVVRPRERRGASMRGGTEKASNIKEVLKGMRNRLSSVEKREPLSEVGRQLVTPEMFSGRR